MLLARCRQFLCLARRRGTDMLSQVLGSRAIVGPPGNVGNKAGDRPLHPLLRTSPQENKTKKPRSTFVLCGCGPLKRRSPGNRVVGSIAGSEGPSRVPSHRLVPRPGLTEHTQPALEFKAREDGCAEKPPCQGCKHCTSLKCVSFTNVRELWPLNTTQDMSFLCVLPLGPNTGKCTSLSQLGLLGAWATHTSDTRPGHKM